MKTYTAARVSWIAEQFEYGHPSTASLAIHRFDRNQSPEAKDLRSKLEEEIIRKQKTQEIVG